MLQLPKSTLFMIMSIIYNNHTLLELHWIRTCEENYHFSFHLSNMLVTLKSDQGPPNWYESVKAQWRLSTASSLKLKEKANISVSTEAQNALKLHLPYNSTPQLKAAFGVSYT